MYSRYVNKVNVRFKSLHVVLFIKCDNIWPEENQSNFLPSSKDASLLFLGEGMLKTAAVAGNYFPIDGNL